MDFFVRHTLHNFGILVAALTKPTVSLPHLRVHSFDFIEEREGFTPLRDCAVDLAVCGGYPRKERPEPSRPTCPPFPTLFRRDAYCREGRFAYRIHHRHRT